MAELDIPGIWTLDVTSQGLTIAKYTGLVMQTLIEVRSQGKTMLGDYFHSGPDLVDNLRSFASSSVSRFAHTDRTDGDVPSTRLSISWDCLPSGVATVSLRSEFACPLDEKETWQSEERDALELRGRLGAELFSASVYDLVHRPINNWHIIAGHGMMNHGTGT